MHYELKLSLIDNNMPCFLFLWGMFFCILCHKTEKNGLKTIKMIREVSKDVNYQAILKKDFVVNIS